MAGNEARTAAACGGAGATVARGGAGIVVIGDGVGTVSSSLSLMHITSASAGGGRRGPVSVLREFNFCDGFDCLCGVSASELKIIIGSSLRTLLRLVESEESVSSMTSPPKKGRTRGRTLSEAR